MTTRLFIAGQAKSGTTLLVALLDSHPELLVMPQETAYFPTVLTKYAPRGRRAQFDYLTKESFPMFFSVAEANGAGTNIPFSAKRFSELFEWTAFDPANAQKDLLVLMVEAYAATLAGRLKTRAWVEKTPANRNYISSIFRDFRRQNCSSRCAIRVRSWQRKSHSRRPGRRNASRCIMWSPTGEWRQNWRGASSMANFGLVVPYEELVRAPSMSMEKVCTYLDITFDPATVLTRRRRAGSGRATRLLGSVFLRSVPSL